MKVGLQTRNEQQGTEQKPKRTYRQQWHNFIADSLLLMSVYRSSHALIFVTDWTGWSAIEPCIQFAGLASKRRVTVMGVLVFLLLFTYGNYDNLSFPCWISSRPRNGNCTEYKALPPRRLRVCLGVFALRVSLAHTPSMPFQLIPITCHCHPLPPTDPHPLCRYRKSQ